MSSQNYDRWLIVPPDARIVGEQEERFPKYGDNNGIKGYTGNLVDAGVIGDIYAGLVDIYPEYDEYYIVRFYGSWSGLNDISVKGDTRNLANDPAHIDEVLNQRFPDLDVSDWNERFFISGPA